MTNVWELEKLEKEQEKKVRLKKAYTERAKEKGDSESIKKAKAEEDEAIAVLERIREDKRRAEAELEEEELNRLRIQEDKEEREKEKDTVEIKGTEKTDTEAGIAWTVSAVIMGIWAFIHLIMLLDFIGMTDTVFQEIEVAIVALIFTLSMVATLFFVCKAIEAG